MFMINMLGDYSPTFFISYSSVGEFKQLSMFVAIQIYVVILIHELNVQHFFHFLTPPKHINFSTITLVLTDFLCIIYNNSCIQAQSPQLFSLIILIHVLCDK